MYIIDKETGCWNWALSKDKFGYGRAKRDGKAYGAHRLALIDSLGRDIKEGYVCMHLCDNPSCVNPDHLKEATQSENMLDCISKGRGGSRGKRKGTSYAKIDEWVKHSDWKEERKERIIQMGQKESFKEIAAKLKLSPKWVKSILDNYAVTLNT